jgi:hypothetical protein
MQSIKFSADLDTAKVRTQWLGALGLWREIEVNARDASGAIVRSYRATLEGKDNAAADAGNYILEVWTQAQWRTLPRNARNVQAAVIAAHNAAFGITQEVRAPVVRKARTPRKAKALGFVIYRGPSLIDGAPIVAIVVNGKSTNEKTGAMVQTYILRADVAPLHAIAQGLDVSICGTCVHRGVSSDADLDPARVAMPRKRSCYVQVGKGASMVYGAFTRGRYMEDADASQAQAACAGRRVRFGTYGDPAAVPAHLWAALARDAAGWTGYTHAWRNEALTAAQRDAIGRLCMASADSADDAQEARTRGLRHFRVRTEDEAMLPREFICPASAEGGKRRQCDTCSACDGTNGRASRASVVIVAHGPLAARFLSLRAAQ